jgi:FkbM family methyltransferase
MTRVATVVIPTHNAAETLGDQLSALSHQVAAPEFEVVVVLNRCIDQSSEVAAKHISELHLTITDADEKPSAAYARNVGAAQSSAPYLLFCDADDRVGDRWIAEMVGALGDGRADFVGGCLAVDREGLPQWMYDGFYRKFDGPHLAFHMAMRYPVGASLGVARVAFEAVAGFDDSFLGSGYEETDLAFRLLRQGFRVGLAPQAIVQYRPRTRLQELLRNQRVAATNLAKFEAKEGRLTPPPSAFQEPKRILRRIGRLVLRDRQWRPTAIVGLASPLIYSDAARRNLASDRSLVALTGPEAQDFVAPLSTPIIGGLALRATVRMASWYVTDGIERQSLAVLEALLDDGKIVVDCGANVGAFTVAAALCVGTTGRVVAFEPDPRTRSLLLGNLRRHRVVERVTIRAEALGAVADRLPFKQYANDVLSGLTDAPPRYKPGSVVQTNDVDVVPLDEAVPLAVDLVKIDVEGFEVSVLEGARQLLERSPDACLIVEVNPASLRSAGRDTAALLDYFPTARWALWLIDENGSDASGKIRPLDRAARDFLDRAPELWYGNLLAVPRHRADEVGHVVAGIGLDEKPTNESPT